MIRPTIFAIITTLSITTPVEAQIPTNAPSTPNTISIHEMLITGPSPLKLHSLAMLTQGNLKDPIDENYLPGFTICAEDSATPVRSVTARLIGEHLVAGKDNPNPKAAALLIKLSHDESADVRYNAIHYGLTEIKYKSPEQAKLLLDIAAKERSEELYDKIIVSLANYQPQVKEILDAKLAKDDDITFFEIYEDFTGNKPPNSAKYLDMPSSRPRMLIISAKDNDPSSSESKLEALLKVAGIENPDVQVSGFGENYVLILKTYITRDYQTAKSLLSNHSTFKITQDIWLTPELEIQIETMRKKIQ